MSHPQAVSDATFQSEVINANLPVLVDIWADWCPPCRAIAPTVEELANDYDGKLKVMKLDVDANPSTAGMFGVMSIPTLLFFKDGKLADRVVGYQPKAKLQETIDSLLKSAAAK